MVDSRCGLHCTECEYKEPCECGGCIETNGHPFTVNVLLQCTARIRTLHIAANVQISLASSSMLILFWIRSTATTLPGQESNSVKGGQKMINNGTISPIQSFSSAQADISQRNGIHTFTRFAGKKNFLKKHTKTAR